MSAYLIYVYGFLLQGRLRSPSQQLRLGYSGSYMASKSAVDVLSNSFYKLLIDHDWEGFQKANNETNSTVSWTYSKEVSLFLSSCTGGMYRTYALIDHQ